MLQKFIWFGLESRLRMFCQDPFLCDLLRLPWPGTSPEPTEAEKTAAASRQEQLREPVRPTEDDDCLALHQSVGWWEGVQEGGASGPTAAATWSSPSTWTASSRSSAAA